MIPNEFPLTRIVKRVLRNRKLVYRTIISATVFKNECQYKPNRLTIVYNLNIKV
jgi:hypothetical protein